MENKIEALPLNYIREVKTFSIVWFGAGNSLASAQVFLVDKKNHRIFMYQMNRAASDETRRIKKQYDTDKDKNWEQKRIGGELYKLMENHEGCIHYYKVIAHSDSALEITEKLHEIRTLQAELYLRICKSPCHWASEEAAEAHFNGI